MKASLVVWSGGADSTLVLYDLAQYSSAKHPVRAVSFEHSQIAASQEHYYARNRVLKVLRERGHHVKHSTVRIEVVGGFEFRSENSNPQAVMWTLATQMLRDDEDLYFGYTSESGWGDGGHFARVFTAYQRAASRRGCLYMPLGTLARPAVLHRLKEAGLLKLVWWCSAGEVGTRRTRKDKKVRKKPCGKCKSCKHHATALWQLKEHGPGFVNDPWNPAWGWQQGTPMAAAKGA